MFTMNRIRSFKAGHWIIISAVIIVILIVAVVANQYNDSTTSKSKRSVISTADSFQYKCKSDAESLLCMEQQYKTFTKNHGVPAAFTKLKAAYAINPSVKTYCHQLSHVIGRTEADMVKNVDEAYSKGDNFCWSGYYHGVMESIVVKIGAKNLPAKLPTICAAIKAQKPYSFYHYNCVHGLGHGVMDVTDSNLFASLKMCDLLSNTWEKESCYGGVFMENEMDEVNPDHHSNYLKADQPMYPCTVVEQQYKYQCYLMQTSHALRVANYDFATVFTECSNIDATYIDVCYQSLGRDASGNSSSNVDKTKANCMLGANSDAQTNCIIGAVKDFVSYYHSDKQANDLCLSLDNSLQQICQTTKTQYYKTF